MLLQPGELEAPWDLGGAFEVPQCLPILTRELPDGSLIFPLLEVRLLKVKIHSEVCTCLAELHL